MRIEEPRTMQELHKIQEQIHEEMSQLPKGERYKRINAKAREFAQKHNLQMNFTNKP